MGKPETFNFLGFTHCCATRRSDGDFALRRLSIAKRVRAFLQKVKEELQKRYAWSVAMQGSWLRSKVRGYFLTNNTGQSEAPGRIRQNIGGVVPLLAKG